MYDRLTRWHRRGVEPSRLRQTIGRLTAVRERAPTAVPRLLSFGLAPSLDRPPKLALRLVHQFIEGRSLSAVFKGMTQQERRRLFPWLNSALHQTLTRWKPIGFVHGDLSFRNILVEFDQETPERIWCIDWTVDLDGFEATPRFSAPEVFRGRRSFATDEYAVRTILKSWLIA